MVLADYLSELNTGDPDDGQTEWYTRLREGVEAGRLAIDRAAPDELDRLERVFNDWVRTEEIKAWYGEPEDDCLFQGTSVASLTIPCELENPLELESIEHLESVIADHYIAQHDRLESTVKDVILEDTEKWRREGLFYGMVLGSKLLSQTLSLTIDEKEVVFEVDGTLVDPHEITSFPDEIRTAYFLQCQERIGCFDGIDDLTQTELETSLVLADISKPHIAALDGKLMLAPVRCNEICALISRHVTGLIREKTDGRINPRSLMVTVYDTDTPYTYHQIAGYFGRRLSPVLPGLAVLGTSGTIDAFRWLYAYRVSLVAQKMMKSSLYSEAHKRFIPFIFFGVLVERDAEILLDLDNLSRLRYRGNLSPYLEFCYLVPKLERYLEATADSPFDSEIESRLR